MDCEEKLKERLSESPLLTLRMDVINKCNLKCIMCHYSDPSIALRPARILTVDQFDNWFGDLGPNVRDIMLSCGDEPLMSPHFSKILEKVSSYGNALDLGFCTNAMLMNGKIRSAMIQYGVTYVLLSVDGATRKTMERIRVKSDYGRVLGNIKALRDLKAACGSFYPKMVIDFVMMRSNIHEAVAFVDICYELGAELIDFRHSIPSAYWDDENEKLENFPEVYNHYRERILERANHLGIKVTLPGRFADADRAFEEDRSDDVSLDEFFAVEADVNAEELPTPKRFDPDFVSQKPIDPNSEFFGSSYCERPFTEVLIRNQTEVLPCPWHGKVLGELNGSNTLKEVFLGKGFSELRAKMMRGEIDSGCLHCPLKKGFLPTEVFKNEDTLDPAR